MKDIAFESFIGSYDHFIVYTYNNLLYKYMKYNFSRFLK